MKNIIERISELDCWEILKEKLVTISKKIIEDFGYLKGIQTKTFRFRNKVFISYAYEDRQNVEKLCIYLEEDGFRPWIYKKDTIGGTIAGVSIQNEIRNSDFFIACLSGDSNRKEGIIKEERDMAIHVQMFEKKSRYLIPVRLDKSPIPENFIMFNPIDYSSHDFSKRLLKALHSNLKLPTKAISPGVRRFFNKPKDEKSEKEEGKHQKTSSDGDNGTSESSLKTIVVCIIIGFVVGIIFNENMQKDYDSHFYTLKLSKSEFTYSPSSELKGIFSDAYNGRSMKLKFLAKIVDVNKKNTDGMSPLMLAAAKGHSQCIETLIRNNIEINAKDKMNRTGLMLSSAAGCIFCSDLLITEGADISVMDNKGRNALFYAAFNGNSGIIDLLIDNECKFDLADNHGCTPLIVASYFGRIKAIDSILDNGADINRVENNGLSPLMVAVQQKDIEVAKLLINRAADVNLRDNDGNSPLIISVKNGDKDFVNLLTTHGARVNISNSGGITPLIFAIKRKKSDIAKMLIKNGADVNLSDNNNMTPLMVASKTGRFKFLDILINSGARIDGKEKIEGSTALILAAKNGHSFSAKILISRGADIHLKDSNGKTALEWARNEKDGEIETILLDNGAGN